MSGKTYVGNGSNKAIIPTMVYIGNSSNKASSVKKIYVGNGNNKAVQVWPNSIIPGTFQRVEYILNTGMTQYINLGIKANSNTRMVADIKITSAENDTQSFPQWVACSGYFGANGMTFRANGPTIFARGSSNCFQGYKYGYNYYANLRRGSQGEYTQIDFNIYYNTRCVIDINRSGGKSYINDTLIESSTLTFSDTEGNILLFGNSYYSTVYEKMDWAASGTCEIYHFILYQNNTKIRDMYPCYRVSDNVIGMYDIVNGTFYTNSGTGLFHKGPNVNNVN